jgi:hypothetical protein
MNRKVVIIVVLVECILAVLLISFFGQAIYNNNSDVKCNEIYFVYENGEKIEDGKIIEVELSDTKMSYQLHYVITPDKATDKSVSFISSKPNEVSVSATGQVTFLRETDVTIIVRTLDGSSKSDTITLIPKRNTSGDVEI